MGGNLSFTLLGARAPSLGASAMGFDGAGGVCHDEKALFHCTFAKGFAMPAPPSFELGSDLGREGNVSLSKPVFRIASLVPMLLNMVVVDDM